MSNQEIQENPRLQQANLEPTTNNQNSSRLNVSQKEKHSSQENQRIENKIGRQECDSRNTNPNRNTNKERPSNSNVIQ